MTTRSRINALAIAVICAGALGLSAGTPAEAASFDGCDDFNAAKQEAMAECQSLGYKRMTYSGWCTSTSYSITTSCG